MTDHIQTYRIRVKGLVQGVGFRPFIYRIAKLKELNGWVENRNDGVLIEINASKESLNDFIEDIKELAPQASDINNIIFEQIPDKLFIDFSILKSENKSNAITDVSPDICVCDDCLTDLKNQKHRIDYSFINCTNCGPRFSIIKDLPYDRDKTTMDPFTLCSKCRKEYEDVLDRRFHAQPVACNQCGPHYSLVLKERIIDDFYSILSETAGLLEDGKIVAIKGVGGFQIACDAANEEAVLRLRNIKNREAKPFALMFSSLLDVKAFAFVSKEEEKAITSWRRPILILKSKNNLAKAVSNGFNTFGCMLPYMPFHYQLFEKLSIPALVMTSGNLSDEPIVIDNKEAVNHLLPMVDAVLTYNREIHNRVDDSVALVSNNKLRMIRRSRGYVPQPVNIEINLEGIVATGAELVNCFCIGKGNQAILSQHIGDLKNLETLDFYSESFSRFKRLFRVNPEIVVHDLHPDYLSTRFALETGIPNVAVQHHHAHIAAVMAENNYYDELIGVSLDGTGLGTDGNIWGGEFLICDLLDFERYKHFEYIPLPGGDLVTKQPWRAALSYLFHYFGKEFTKLTIPFVKKLQHENTDILLAAIEKGVNSPLSSSAGRLFDAIAAITGVCYESGFHAEAPMRLEDVIDDSVTESYFYEMKDSVSFKPMFMEIINDLERAVDISVISAKFHNTIVRLIVEMVEKIKKERGISTVALSGGVFQNKFLLAQVEQELTKRNLRVLTHKLIPANDAGIALGQLLIAGMRRAKKIS